MSGKLESKCFIIQPLDVKYKKRCDDIYKPAIKEAGLSSYRVDEHYEPVKLKILSIQDEIKKSRVCLADITEHNPNVWYEVGFADGQSTPVVLICEKDKKNDLPFDVNQRDVYFYDTTSQGDWARVQREITKRIEIACESIDKESPSHQNGKSVAKTRRNENEFGKPEYFILQALYYLVHEDRSLGDWGNDQRLQEEMKKRNFNIMEIIDAIENLQQKGMIEKEYHPETPYYDAEDLPDRWLITNKGRRWCLKNKTLPTGRSK